MSARRSEPLVRRSVADALSVAHRFWGALARGDIEDLRAVLSSAWWPVPDDFAALYLAARGLTPEACTCLGMLSTVDVLGTDHLRLRFAITDRTEPFEAGATLVTWPLEVVLEHGAWRVDRSSGRPSVGTIEMPVAGPTGPPAPTH